jgi:hypothetical protein
MKTMLAAFAATLLVGCASNSNVRESAQDVSVELRPYSFSAGVKTYQSPKDLLQRITDLGGPQKEFETDADFEKRISALGNYAIFSDIDKSNIKFNKVTGELDFSKPIIDAKDFGYKSGVAEQDYKSRYLSIMLPSVDYITGEYVGQNAYGAKANVEILRVDRVHIVSPPIPSNPIQPIFASLKSKLNISAAEFEKEKENVRLALIVEPVPRYLSFEKYYGQATIINKKQVTSNNYFLSSRLMGVSLVNIRTKQIYSQSVRMEFK